MSGAGDGRWRRPGSQQQTQTQTQTQNKQPAQSQSSSRERPNSQSASGNAWIQRDHKAKENANLPQQKPATQNTNASQTTSAQEEHVPVKSFNAAEAKQFLKKGYQDAVKAAGDEKKLLWKPQDGTSGPKQAWGTRTDRMAGNRDFWALLRREISQTEQNKPTSS